MLPVEASNKLLVPLSPWLWHFTTSKNYHLSSLSDISSPVGWGDNDCSNMTSVLAFTRRLYKNKRHSDVFVLVSHDFQVQFCKSTHEKTFQINKIAPTCVYHMELFYAKLFEITHQKYTRKSTQVKFWQNML